MTDIRFFTTLRILSVVFLILFFYKYFCIPTIDKFESEEVQTVEYINDDSIEAQPAITICGRGMDQASGWKDDTRPSINGSRLIACCNGKNYENGSIIDCINYKTQSLFEENLVWFNIYNISSQIDKEKNPNLKLQKDFFDTFSGMCTTLFNMTYVNSSDLLYMFWYNMTLVPGLKIFVHDPNYFLMSYNPDVVPRVVIISARDDKYKKYTMRRIKHSRQARTAYQCTMDKEYSFTGCLRNSISKHIGCR